MEINYQIEKLVYLRQNLICRNSNQTLEIQHDKNKNSANLKRSFERSADTLPYQNVSPYEVVVGNLYDCAKQIDILEAKPNLVFTPVKTLLEKFRQNSFLKIIRLV